MRERESKKDNNERKVAKFSKNDANIELARYIVEKEKARQRKDIKIQNRNILKAKWEMYKENIAILENENDLIKSKIGFIKGVLKEYYLNLLSKGTDIRYLALLDRKSVV